MNILIRLLVFVVTYIVVVFTLGVVLGVIGAPEFAIVAAFLVAFGIGHRRREL